MTEGVRIVEDGVASPVEKAPSRPSWLLGVAWFGLGLGLGVLVMLPTSQEAATTPSEATTTAPSQETVPPGVKGAIPDFPDAIVAVAETTGSSFEHVLWPLDDEPVVRAMDGGQDVAIDVDSVFFALSEQIPDLDEGLLSLGRFNDMRPVSLGVSSYAFHDSDGGGLGFTVPGNSGVQIFIVHPNLVIENVATLDAAGATIGAWGDWGWAIQDGERIVLLTPDGVQKDIAAGRALASHESGWVLVVDGDVVELVSAGGGVSRIGSNLNVGEVRTAAFSVDGAKVALGGQRGAEVVDLAEGTVESLTAFSTSHVAWSSDSRFVLTSSGAGMLIHDLETGLAQPAFRNFNLLVSGVIPVAAP